jgi:coenzyme PQQ precursor peptide PqqA
VRKCCAKGLAISAAVAYIGGGPDNRETPEEATMEWRTPKLIEIACGCEINAYFPADL